MKNVMKTIAAAAFSLFLFNQSATALPAIEPTVQCKNNTCENFRVGMYRVKGTESMNMLVEKQKGERLSIRITDQKGKVLHEEMIGKKISKFGKRLNFSAMQDGNYILEIFNEREKIVKNILLSTNEIKEVDRRIIGMN